MHSLRITKQIRVHWEKLYSFRNKTLTDPMFSKNDTRIFFAEPKKVLQTEFIRYKNVTEFCQMYFSLDFLLNPFPENYPKPVKMIK